MQTITQLPKDGSGLLDGLKGLFFDAAGRYVSKELPTTQEKNIADANRAAIQAETETIRAQNEYLIAGKGISATTLFIGGALIGLTALYLIVRK